MREFDRIDRICELLKVVWKNTPDWRFGQLVVNYFGVDPFYVEDNIIEDRLNQLTSTNKEHKEEKK